MDIQTWTTKILSILLILSNKKSFCHTLREPFTSPSYSALESRKFLVKSQ